MSVAVELDLTDEFGWMIDDDIVLIVVAVVLLDTCLV